MTYDIKQKIAPMGYLRGGINMSNFLLVVGKNEDGDPIGISPDIARLIAKKIDVVGHAGLQHASNHASSS